MRQIPIFTLTLQTGLGANLRDAVIEAIRISILLKVAVTFDFWNENLTVWPDTEVDKFFELNKKRLGL